MSSTSTSSVKKKGPVENVAAALTQGLSLPAQHVIEVCEKVFREQLSNFANTVKRTCAAVCPLYGDVPMGAPGPPGQKGPPGPPVSLTVWVRCRHISDIEDVDRNSWCICFISCFCLYRQNKYLYSQNEYLYVVTEYCRFLSVSQTFSETSDSNISVVILMLPSGWSWIWWCWGRVGRTRVLRRSWRTRPGRRNRHGKTNIHKYANLFNTLYATKGSQLLICFY